MRARICRALPDDLARRRTAKLPERHTLVSLANVSLPVAENALDMNDAPIVVVDGHDVLVDGEVVGSVAVIDSSHRLQRIEGLFERMKKVRADWLAGHPQQAFPGECNLVIDASASAAVVKSVFQTAAFAGCPYPSFVVRRQSADGASGGLGRVTADAQVPGPPTASESDRGKHGPVAGAPALRGGASTVNGRPPPEVVQRIVRQNFGGLRGCYERGLAKDPRLSGRVTVRFVIDRRGNVTDAAPLDPPDAKTPRVPDPSVVACIVDHFAKLSFPAPEGGTVTVVYPVNFNPGE